MRLIALLALVAFVAGCGSNGTIGGVKDKEAERAAMAKKLGDDGKPTDPADRN